MTKDGSRCSQRFVLRVCDGPSCGVTHESERLVEHIQRVIDGDADLKERVQVVSYTCFGRCDDGPNVFLHATEPGDDPYDEPDTDVFEQQRGFYPGMNEAKLTRVIVEHAATGVPIDDLVDDY